MQTRDPVQVEKAVALPSELALFHTMKVQEEVLTLLVENDQVVVTLEGATTIDAVGVQLLVALRKFAGSRFPFRIGKTPVWERPRKCGLETWLADEFGQENAR